MEGNQFLSRSTVAAGRGVLSVSGAVILVEKLQIDISNLELLGVPILTSQYQDGVIFVIAILWLSLLINWIGDLVYLGWWRSANSAPQLDGIDDIGYRFDQAIKRIARDLAVERDRLGTDRDIQQLRHHLERVGRSYWYYNNYTRFFVIGWGFLVPTGAAGYAMFLIVSNTYDSGALLSGL